MSRLLKDYCFVYGNILWPIITIQREWAAERIRNFLGEGDMVSLPNNHNGGWVMYVHTYALVLGRNDIQSYFSYN